MNKIVGIAFCILITWVSINYSIRQKSLYQKCYIENVNLKCQFLGMNNKSCKI